LIKMQLFSFHFIRFPNIFTSKICYQPLNSSFGNYPYSLNVLGQSNKDFGYTIFNVIYADFQIR